jgi:XTP/dITP diphosphohydrolase
VGNDITILIATTNLGKLREVREILTGLPIELTTLEDHPGLPQAVEDADTFAGNAERKALHYARLLDGWTLADDSGLVVDALNGAPGVHSARYAGPQADPAANNAKLIAALAGVPPETRTAHFCCAVALAGPSRVMAKAFGTVDGVIIDHPRGDGGFGYDPHFYVPRLGLTTAEMTSEQKNLISHRGQAFRAIRRELERFLQD